MLKLTIEKNDLAAYVERQLSHFFPDGQVTRRTLLPYIDNALQRLTYCFSHIKLKYYFDGKYVLFNHLNTDQYAMFLYFLSNSIYKAGGDLILASKVYALNKALHAIDVFYEVQLPDICLFSHPVGTVLGRGKFSNYFVIYQHCTVGSNLDGIYPRLGEGVVMYCGSGVIGNCTVGNNCWLSVATQVLDMDLPSDSIAFGKSPDIVIKPTGRNVVRDIFGIRVTCAP